MKRRCGCPDCDPPVTGCLNPLLEPSERDTEKLVEALEWIAGPQRAEYQTDTAWGLALAQRAEDALAGFSVGAGEPGASDA